jgi:hypothetical protein
MLVTLNRCRLQEETARVEEHLLDGSFTQGIIKCFTTSKANAFENLLEPLQKLLRLSPPIALSLAHPDLFARMSQKFQSSKAVVRLNLLRIIRSICDSVDEPGSLLIRYDLYDTIHRLAEYDGAVLVRNMAGELLKSSEASDKLGMGSSKRRPGRRSSSANTPPGLISSRSMPPTPTSGRSMQSTNYFLDREPRERSAANGRLSYRPVSRDGLGPNGTPVIINGSEASKSRLPRTTSGRTSQQSMLGSPKKQENIIPSATAHQASPMPAPNSRRRRHVSGETRWT